MPNAAARALRRAIVALVLTLLGLVLIVAALSRCETIGWGGLIWLASFVAMGLIRAPHAKRTRDNAVIESRKDLSETLMLAAMFATMMLLPLLHLATGVFVIADYALPAWAMVIGALMQVPFLWLCWRSHADLGRNWSPTLEMRAAHWLVTQGVYARIRHPMNAAIWLSTLVQPLLIPNWIAGFLVVPAFAIMYLVRTPREEAMMRDRFGTAYDDYTRRAGPLWPRRSTAQ